MSAKAHYISIVTHKLTNPIYHLLNTINCLYHGVSVGKNAHFRGFCHFKRLQNSIITIGDNCTFLSDRTANSIGLYCPCLLTADKNATLTIGNNVGLSGTRIWATTVVKIGNNVKCGANTLITDTDAHNDDPRSGKNAPITIADNVWLGTNVIVLKGVSIGENTLIGAGSVVSKSIPANVIAAGNPCRVIRNLYDEM